MRILVIEDEHKIANSIKKGLAQESYAVDAVYDGQSGFDLASTESYDLIILDILLPKMDGMAVCKELRKRQIHIPIIMLTAKGQVSDKVKGLDAGADDYMTKPFSFEELLARMRALIRRPIKSMGNEFVFGDLTLNTRTHIVKRGEALISLTSREYSILEFLMRHPDQIVDKDQIINHVWDYDSDVLPNTVEVYINYLRNKIGSGLIETVRGFGYKMVRR